MNGNDLDNVGVIDVTASAVTPGVQFDSDLIGVYADSDEIGFIHGGSQRFEVSAFNDNSVFTFGGGSLTLANNSITSSNGSITTEDFVCNKLTSADPVWVGDSANGTFRTQFTPQAIGGEYIDMSSSGLTYIISQGTTPVISYVKTNASANKGVLHTGIVNDEYQWNINNDNQTTKVGALAMDMADGSTKWDARLWVDDNVWVG